MRVLIVGEWGGSEDSRNSEVLTGLSQTNGVDQLSVLRFRRPTLADRNAKSPMWEVFFLDPTDVLGGKCSFRANQIVEGFLSSAKYESTRFICLKLLNRQDFTGTFRLIDREVVFFSALLALSEVFASVRPQISVFPVTAHEFLPYLASILAQHLGSRVIHFQPSSIAPVQYLKEGDRKLFLSLDLVKRCSAIEKHIEYVFEDKLRGLVDGQDPSYIEAQKSRASTDQSFRGRVRAVFGTLKAIFVDRFPEAQNFSWLAPQASVVSRIAAVYLNRSISQANREAVEGFHRPIEPSGVFAVFALHYEPERTSIPDGLPIDFQGNAIIQVRNFIPEEMTLAIKEHSSQQSSSLRGYLGRSPHFYSVVENLPNTIILSPSVQLSALAERARCVFTLTGTVAIESVLRGTPVIYFGSPWWEGLPGAVRFDKDLAFDWVENWVRPTKESLSTFFETSVFVDAIPGVGSETRESARSKFGDLPVDFFHEEAEAVVTSLTEVISGR